MSEFKPTNNMEVDLTVTNENGDTYFLTGAFVSMEHETSYDSHVINVSLVPVVGSSKVSEKPQEPIERTLSVQTDDYSIGNLETLRRLYSIPLDAVVVFGVNHETGRKSVQFVWKEDQ